MEFKATVLADGRVLFYLHLNDVPFFARLRIAWQLLTQGYFGFLGDGELEDTKETILINQDGTGAKA